MQRDSSHAYGGNTATFSSPIRSQNQQISSPQTIATSGFTSIFPSKTSLPSSVSLTPSPCSCNEENNSVATETRLYLARLTLEYQELLDRYGLCLTHLQESAKETEALRQENAKLSMENKDLTNRLCLLTQASLQNHYLSPTFPSLSIINDFRNLSVRDNGRNSRSVSGDISETSPTSVIMNNNFETRGTERVSLPKSISVRSSGYLKMTQDKGSSVVPSRTNRPRVAAPVVNGTQRVYVHGENKEEEPLELDVYNQGMFKTELCNKWQETGACPYGDHCQFAHGIDELRPVIRHPRYKTEVCRIILSGDTCPYGHRCHFRHALTEQERFKGAGGGAAA